MISADDRSGFEVSVHRVGGEAFNEYDVKHTVDQVSKTSHSSCWLESETDVGFDIKLSVSKKAQRQHGLPDLIAVIYVDGRLIHRVCLGKRHTDTHLTWSTMRFMESGSIYEGQLKFAALRTTDDDEEVTLAGAQLQALGKIRVDLVRGKLGAVVNRVTNCLVNPDLGVASEKGKKLGGGVGYTDKKVAVSSQTSTNWTPIDSETIPYHRLDLNYRPRPVLQLLGVVEPDAPRPRAPTPPTAGPVAAQAGPSRKRNAEVVFIDDDDEDVPDVKPDNKARLATRVGWLARQLQNAQKLIKRQEGVVPADIVDLTGDD